jgi:plasmid stability protein
VKRRHDASREDDARLVLRVAASTGVPVIVWPALDAYEVLSDVERVVELGLDPEELASQTSKPEPGSRLGRGDK